MKKVLSVVAAALVLLLGTGAAKAADAPAAQRTGTVDATAEARTEITAAEKSTETGIAEKTMEKAPVTAAYKSAAGKAEPKTDAAEEEPEINVNEEPGTPTNLPADVVEQILPDKLKEYAAVFCEEEQEHGVNLLFVASIARQETSSGTAGVAKSRNNLFGNRGSNGYMRFDGFEESIRYEFDVLERLYIDQGRDTVSSISKKYCVPAGPWASAVSSILSEYAEKANDALSEI